MPKKQQIKEKVKKGGKKCDKVGATKSTSKKKGAKKTSKSS